MIALLTALWLYADFDRPMIIGGKAVDVTAKSGEYSEGKFGRGYFFTSAAKRCENEFFNIADRDLTDGFPWKRGTFSCFYRRPAEGGVNALFGFGGFWQYQWTWGPGCFSCQDANRGPNRVTYKTTVQDDAWHHFAATWNDEALLLYEDGVKVAERKNPKRVDMREVQRAVLRIGCRGDGAAAANLYADEIAIFDEAKGADEVKAMSAAVKPILADDAIVFGHVDFPFAWRNEENAALRMKAYFPAEGEYPVIIAVAGHSFPVKRFRAKAGLNRLDVPFDPALFRPGEYDWKLTVGSQSTSGRLAIRGRVDRNEFKLHSWGGSKALAFTNLLTIGLNAVNTGCGFPNRGTRAYLAHDVFINYRLENSRKWAELGLDRRAIARDAAKSLEYARGLHLWATTLVNSEVYGSRLTEVTNNPVMRARAETALGHAPDVTISYPPNEISFKNRGIAPFSGVFPAKDPTYRTLRWYWNEGFHTYAVNEGNRDAIHRLSPGNVVWSEPNPSPVGLDMIADWVYDYKAETALQTLRRQYALARDRKVPNMPTLGMGYWHTFPPRGTHPTLKDKNGKSVSVTLCQSCDEVMIKSWMAIGAVRSDNLGYFAVDTWQSGAEGCAAYAADPSAGIDCIGETDAIPRYGEFVRRTLRPAAMLLRGIDPVKAPVAVVWPKEILWAGGGRWSDHHYRNQICDALARLPFAFDFVADAGFTKENLTGYRYVLAPMLSVVTDEHDEILRSLPSSVKIVTDSHAKTKYPGGTELKDLRYRVGRKGVEEFNWATCDEPLRAFFAKEQDSLHRALGAWSDEDGTNAYTFVKAYRDVKFVTVVNNLRRDGGSVMNEFCRRDGYRPLGAPQTITTHFDLPAGGALYEFNPAGARTSLSRELSLPYAPGEGRLFAVYPRPLKELSLSVEGEPARGGRAAVRIRITDSRGAAPGRQVVKLTVADPSGREHDETGLYAVEGGEELVPLRFALDDGTGSWKLSAGELTTGLAGDSSFKLR